MDIERYDPWEEFDRLQEQVNEILSSFFERMPGTGRHVDFAPPIELYLSEAQLVLRVELPGVVEDDVDISATATTVVIRGERDKPADAVAYLRREWAYGLFERRVELPMAVVPERLSAKYTDGVFEIRLPLA